METVLSIQKISKHYGKIHAVDKLSFDVLKGQVFGLLGPNGSGKTTTLSIILGLVGSDSGVFQWFGRPPTKESRKRIGSVIENPNFYPYLSAEKNLRIVADIKGKGFDDIDRVLKLSGLYDRRNHAFRTYSFGMKQRLAIASALLSNPELLILDEPTNGLDPQGIAHIREIILEVAAQGITIILASHLLDEVQKICSHVAVLQKGKLLFTGRVSNLLTVSDCIELSSGNLSFLESTVSAHPLYRSVEKTDGKLLVSFSGPLSPAELNDFLYRKGIILSHLMQRKQTLEQQFLKLLEENRDTTAKN